MHHNADGRGPDDDTISSSGDLKSLSDHDVDIDVFNDGFSSDGLLVPSSPSVGSTSCDRHSDFLHSSSPIEDWGRSSPMPTYADDIQDNDNDIFMNASSPSLPNTTENDDISMTAESSFNVDISNHQTTSTIDNASSVPKTKRGRGRPRGTAKRRKADKDVNASVFVTTRLLRGQKSTDSGIQASVHQYERVQVIVSPRKKHTVFPPNSRGYHDASLTPAGPIMAASHITLIASTSNAPINHQPPKGDIYPSSKDILTIIETLAKGCVMVASIFSHLSFPSYLISTPILFNHGAHLISLLIYGCGLVSSSRTFWYVPLHSDVINDIT